MVSVLGLLFTFVGFFLSIYGLFAFLFGVLLFIALPIIPKITNHFHAFARLHLWLATRMLKRAALVVSEHGDLLLKRMTPDDIGTERIEFADDTKEFEDPTNALHWWYGIPFALADEVHGILFDPRWAAVGAREQQIQDRDEDVVQATRGEQDERGIIGWQNAVYEFPRKTYELVTLGHIRNLITGSERAEHPQRVKTFYENSRVPYLTGGSTARYILIVVAMVAPFAACWLIADQLMSGGGPTDTVGFGMALLLISLESLWDQLTSVDWKAVVITAAVYIAVLAPLPLVFVFLWTTFNPVFAVLVYIIMGMGFWLLPILFMVLRVSTTAANWLSGFLFRLGFMGYDTPIFEWTPRQYRVRELSKLDDVDESKAAWYGLAGSMVGFTFTPGPESWGKGVVPNAELENKMVEATDANTNIPVGYRIWEGQTRGKYGAMIPKQISDACYYLYSGIVLEAMTFAATGDKSAERLTQSKDEFGEDEGMSEGRLGATIAVAAGLSFFTGVFVFFL